MRASVAVLLLAFAGLAVAQATADEIAAQLKGHPLFLRGQWQKNKLKFDLTGTLTSAAPYLPFTLCGVDVQSVKQKSDHLQITGRRMGVSFAADRSMRRVAIDGPSYDGHMSLEIAGPSGSDYRPALRAIFAPDLASMIPQMPSYWSTYSGAFSMPSAVPPILEAAPGSQSVGPANPAGKPAANTTKPTHVGGSVRAPRVLRMVDPSYTDAARMLRKSGNVELYLVVNADGTPSRIRIVRPLGLGLDESAVDAVSKYVFEPARQNGTPVVVDIYIDVNFQIF